MGRAPAMLTCVVDGEALRIPFASVQRVSLRLPIRRASDGQRVELGTESWPVRDDRAAAATMRDHFVFLNDDSGPRVIVVDRVVGIEPASPGEAEQGGDS